MNYPSNCIEEIISVNASVSYDVLIGSNLLQDAGALAASVVKPCRAVLVTDATGNAL